MCFVPASVTCLPSFGALPAGSLAGGHVCGSSPPSQGGGGGLSGDVNNLDVFLNDSDSITYFSNARFLWALNPCSWVKFHLDVSEEGRRERSDGLSQTHVLPEVAASAYGTPV